MVVIDSFSLNVLHCVTTLSITGFLVLYFKLCCWPMCCIVHLGPTPLPNQPAWCSNTNGAHTALRKIFLTYLPVWEWCQTPGTMTFPIGYLVSNGFLQTYANSFAGVSLSRLLGVGPSCEGQIGSGWAPLLPMSRWPNPMKDRVPL